MPTGPRAATVDSTAGVGVEIKGAVAVAARLTCARAVAASSSPAVEVVAATALPTPGRAAMGDPQAPMVATRSEEARPKAVVATPARLVVPLEPRPAPAGPVPPELPATAVPEGPGSAAPGALGAAVGTAVVGAAGAKSAWRRAVVAAAERTSARPEPRSRPASAPGTAK